MIKVSNVQKGNNLLEYLTKMSWYFDSGIISDYEINNYVGVVFLSLRFHICKPEYISKRLRKCMNKYKVQILLLQIDIKNYDACIEEIFNTSFNYSFVLILSFSAEESSRYIWALDMNENRTAVSLRKRNENRYDMFITAFPKINKNDLTNIKKSFRNIKSLLNAEAKTLENINGMGGKKACILAKYAEMEFID